MSPQSHTQGAQDRRAHNHIQGWVAPLDLAVRLSPGVTETRSEKHSTSCRHKAPAHCDMPQTGSEVTPESPSHIVSQAHRFFTQAQLISPGSVHRARFKLCTSKVFFFFWCNHFIKCLCNLCGKSNKTLQTQSQSCLLLTEPGNLQCFGFGLVGVVKENYW